MHRIRKILLAIILFLCASGTAFFFLWVHPRYVVPIMTYHSVNPDAQSSLNAIKPENFKRHMDYLKRKGYAVISLDELVEKIKAKEHFKKKYVVITFDDGYEDNYLYAYPTLKAHGFPATIFLITSEIDKKGWLSWAQIKEMEAAGITFGSHTDGHPYLPGVNESRIRAEFKESKKILERNLGHSIDLLAYPIGGFNQDAKRIAAETGYKAACTTNRGYDRMNRDLYEIKRIRFGDEDKTDAILGMKLSGYNNLFRRPKPSY